MFVDPANWVFPRCAVISQATDSDNFRVLHAAALVMATMVVTLNRLVWRPLYALVSARFELES